MQSLVMACSALLSQIAHFFSFLREHPLLLALFLLLLSAPLCRILLYFTPLLLSTALCIFALFTLAPYVTATDAEVERQSALGANSSQRKKSSTASSSSNKGENGASRHGSLPSSSSSRSVLSASAVCPAPSPSPSPSPAAENSWMSWMKGLNDIGRMWMESKLAEQGLSLSEPANRETLLALIEGSFAELVTTKESISEIFPAEGNDAAMDSAGVKQLKDEGDDRPKRNSTEGVMEGTVEQQQKSDAGSEEVVCGGPMEGLWQQERDVGSGLECPGAEDGGDAKQGASKQAGQKDPPPVISGAEAAADTAGSQLARAEEPFVRAGGNRCNTTAPECKEGFNAAAEASSKQRSSQALSLRTRAAKEKPPSVHHESSLPTSVDVGGADVHSTTIMPPKTPSRIPAPSKIFEASRKIFSKEDQQSKSMLPRAPFQSSSSAARMQPPSSTTQSKLESTVSALRFPARRFLERSKSISGKDASKLGSSAVAEDRASGNVEEEECVTTGGKVKPGAGACGHDAQEEDVGDLGDFTDGANVEGPKFDEDLEVEEAQALVRSELKMLEVELEEVAAKLPKLDEASTYQKTPVKSVSSATPTSAIARTPLRSNVALFSASPISK